MARPDPNLTAIISRSHDDARDGEREAERSAFPIWPGLVLIMFNSILFGAVAVDRWLVDFMSEDDQLLFVYTGLLFAIVIATLGVLWVILFEFNRSPGK